MGYEFETVDVTVGKGVPKTATMRLPTGATCDKCGEHIPRLDLSDPLSTNLDGGMEIRADGWYGGYIDTGYIIGGGPRKVLCTPCARAFMQEWFPEWVEDEG